MQACARIPGSGSGASFWRRLAAPQLPLVRAFAVHRLCSPSGWSNGRLGRSESTPGRLTRVHAFATRSLPNKPRETRTNSLQGAPRPWAVDPDSYAALNRWNVACVWMHQRLLCHRYWRQGRSTHKQDQTRATSLAQLCSCCGCARVSEKSLTRPGRTMAEPDRFG